MTNHSRFPGASRRQRKRAEVLTVYSGDEEVNLAGEAAHRLSQRRGGGLRLPQQDVGLVRQLAALFDEAASGFSRGGRSLTYLGRQPRAGVEVRAGALGEIRAALRAEVRLVAEKV